MDQLIEFVRNLRHLTLRRRIAHRHPQRVHPVAIVAGGGDGIRQLLKETSPGAPGMP
jgi:hypothetical protein